MSATAVQTDRRAVIREALDLDLTRPTIPLLDACREGYGMQRTAAYRAAVKDELPFEVIEAGGRKYVRTTDFLRALDLIDDSSTTEEASA